jgi:hypothetical protein
MASPERQQVKKLGLNGVIPALLGAAHTLRVGVREAREGCAADLILGAVKD